MQIANCRAERNIWVSRDAEARRSGVAQRERKGYDKARERRLCVGFGFDDEIRPASLPRKVRTLAQRAFRRGNCRPLCPSQSCADN